MKNPKINSVSYINDCIEMCGNKGKISDGSHTFEELYLHRNALFISLVNQTERRWEKSYLHYDFTRFEGYFIVTGYISGKNISYHLPIEYRDKVEAKEVARAREWDGHTPDDVVKTLLM